LFGWYYGLLIVLVENMLRIEVVFIICKLDGIFVEVAVQLFAIVM